MDGEWRDPTVEEPIARITAILQDMKDRVLVERYALWLLKRDPHAGLRVRETFLLGVIPFSRYPQILTSTRDGKRSSSESDLALLQQIRQVDVFAGHEFLEHLVLEKRSTVRQ